MRSGNSPSKVLSRNLHGNFFDAVSDHYMRDWIPLIYLHIQKCQHIKCCYYRQRMVDAGVDYNLFRFNEEFFTFKSTQLKGKDA